MPELSRFFGIVIRMFYSDHEPAHFHAIYGEYEVLKGEQSSCARNDEKTPRSELK